MTAFQKLSVVVARSDAPACSAAVEETVEPDALAVTSFALEGTGDWLIEAYFDETTRATDLSSLIQELGGLSARGAKFEWRFEPVPDEDWTAKVQRELVPVRAGRFVIHGSHDRGRVRPSRWAIEIEAGEAFGTAHHATTRGCLEAIDRLARGRSVRRIADVGCGTGVLAIAAAKAWPHARIVAGDTDANSVRIACDNARLNGVGGRIRAYTAAGLAHPGLRASRSYDLILANILAEPLVRLAPTLARARTRDGVLVLSGLLVEQTREVLGAYRAQGLFCRARLRRGEWMTLILQ